MTSSAVESVEGGVQVADLIVDCMEQLGIEYVFGVPGGAIEPLYNALARSQRRGGPRPVVARHETGAAFMADGYARATGRIGVCCATSGPGSTNLITGVACAYDNNVPLLVITGQPALPSFGKKALQESACTGINVQGMFSHCTRYDTLVSHVGQVGSKLVNALMHASGVPCGPVHLSLPVDVQRAPLPGGLPAYNLASLLRGAVVFDQTLMPLLLAEISRARRMVIVIGGGHACSESITAILQLAEMTGSRFVSSPDGKGLVDPRHPLYRGVFGFAGHDSAEAALRDDTDLILAIGVSLNEWTSGAWSEALLNSRLVHIDESEEHLARSPMARLHVRGHIRTVCEQLVGMLRLEERSSPPGASEHGKSVSVGRCAGAAHKNPDFALQEEAKFVSDARPIKPQRLMRELSRRFPPGALFLAEAGNSAAWAIHYLQPHERRIVRRDDHPARGGHRMERRRRGGDLGWLWVLMDFAPMGWAVGASIGCARGVSHGPVVCVTGDGSYLMSGQEISVAAAEGLSVIFVILNDAALGMVKHGQRMAGAERVAFELPVVDFTQQAASMGIPAHVVYSPDDMGRLDYAAMSARKGPTLIDVRIDGEEVPPIGLRLKALGTHK